MKQVVQLDDQGYFVGYATAYESPLEQGVFLLPAGSVDTEAPAVPDGKRAKWTGQGWAFEDLPQPDPEPQPEPETIEQWRARAAVSRAQGKAALIQMGLWQQVLDFVAAIPDATQRAVAEVALHDTQNWERSSPFLNQAAQALGMTDEQLDDLFRAAAQVRL